MEKATEKVLLYKLRLSIRALFTIANNQTYNLFMKFMFNFGFYLFILINFCSIYC